MKNGVAITLIICGTALVLMPQVHHAVVAANTLYAQAIAMRFADATGGEAPVIEPVRGQSWVAGVSVGAGVGMILAGACGVAGRGRDRGG